jgi:CBS domain-containing protein
LPVLKEGHVLGVITPLSLRNLLKPEYLLRYIRVAEVMQRQVVMVNPDDSVQDVVRRMAATKVSCVIVIEPKSQQPQGVVTEYDIVRLKSLGTNFDTTAVKWIMSSPVHSQDLRISPKLARFVNIKSLRTIEM